MDHDLGARPPAVRRSCRLCQEVKRHIPSPTGEESESMATAALSEGVRGGLTAACSTRERLQAAKSAANHALVDLIDAAARARSERIQLLQGLVVASRRRTRQQLENGSGSRRVVHAGSSSTSSSASTMTRKITKKS